MLELKSQVLLCLQDKGILYDIDMSFKDRLRQARMAIPKLTQADVAQALGVKPQAVSGWERGKNKPGRDKILALSSILNVSVEWLLGDLINRPKMEQITNDNVIPSERLFGVTDLPVWGTRQNIDGLMILTPGPVTAVTRPSPLLNVKDAYGLIVADDSMSPALKPGWTALINPILPPVAGNMCVFRDESMKGAVPFRIAMLRRQSREMWYAREINPELDFYLKRPEWVGHVIIGSYYGW